MPKRVQKKVVACAKKGRVGPKSEREAPNGLGGAKWDKRGAKWAGGRQICGLRGGANWGAGVVGGRRGGRQMGGALK